MIPTEIHDRFIDIHYRIPCAHGNEEMEYICDQILTIPPDIKGGIIECGCYLGGSTAKLSVVAKHLGRKLIVCDSFQGLPPIEPYDKKHTWCWGNSTQEFEYTEGLYISSLEEVKARVAECGEPDVVEYIPGWFKDTLPKMKRRKFASIVLDVDLVESIKTCIQYLWPMLRRGCRFWTHEAVHDLTIDLFKDVEYWMTNFGCEPPPFYANHPRSSGILIEGGLLGFGYADKL